MESKTGWSIIFNIISYIILCGFIALGVLTVMQFIKDGISFPDNFFNNVGFKYMVYGTAGSLIAFILMKIVLNIDKNVRITADNSYDILMLVERYVKSASISTDCLSKKDLKAAVKKDRIVKKMEEKRDILSSDVVIDEEQPDEKIKGKAKSVAAVAVPSASLADKYSYEDWKRNLDGRIVCKKCGSPVTVLNSNVGIPVLFCSKAAAKGDCDNKYITANNFAAQFLKWYNLAYDKRVKDFDFDEFNKSVGKVVLSDGTVTISGKDAISYAPNGNGKKKASDI